mmetsp:Transcript_34416/g.97514  ORF Transcript_34416/g.97514 Transcript_34416/m.97514 type:complete len:331 (-) Transcript_34416:111-1103(-)
MIRKVAFITQVLFASSVALLTQASKGHGDYRYNTLTVPMYSEMVKLAISGFSLFSEYKIQKNSEAPLEFKLSNFLAASIPAILYLITNNLNFFVIKEIGALSFQILNNLKIVTAAITFQVALSKHLSALKWRAVLLLTIGSLISQLKDCISDGSSGFNGSVYGYLAQILTCWLSAAASVFCEVYLKTSNQSIHWQNSQLYIWGLIFSFIALYSHGDPRGIAVLWDGHDPLSTTLVFSLALTGLATAFVLKYLDNIAKNFAVVAAMFVAALASVMWFNEKFTLHLGIGLAIASIATDLYVRDNTAVKPPPPKDELKPIITPLMDKNFSSKV